MYLPQSLLHCLWGDDKSLGVWVEYTCCRCVHVSLLDWYAHTMLHICTLCVQSISTFEMKNGFQFSNVTEICMYSEISLWNAMKHDLPICVCACGYVSTFTIPFTYIPILTVYVCTPVTSFLLLPSDFAVIFGTLCT